MPLNIRDAEVDRLAKQLAALNHTTKFQAVKDALRRELARAQRKSFWERIKPLAMTSPPIRTAASSSTRRFSTNSAGRPENSVCRRFGDGCDPFAGGERRVFAEVVDAPTSAPLVTNVIAVWEIFAAIYRKRACLCRSPRPERRISWPPPTFSCWPLRRANWLSRWLVLSLRTPPLSERRRPQ